MQKYSHDYTLPYEAACKLSLALSQDSTTELKQLIIDARQMLYQYLSQDHDNMRADNDVYPGWYKATDVDGLINH